MNIVYVEVPEPLKSELITYSYTIRESEIIERVTDPHITIKALLQTDDIELIAKTIGKFIPIRIMFGKTGMFMADEFRDNDVVKIDVFGMSLVRLNRKLSSLPSDSKYNFYFPHLTTAYLHKYEAIQYIGSNPFIGRRFVVDNIIFKTDSAKYRIFCNGDILDA